jgi:hypothetical protein
MPDTAYRVVITSASLAVGGLKIRECVIYFPPSFQPNTKKSIVLRVLELRLFDFDNSIMFWGETRIPRSCFIDIKF